MTDARGMDSALRAGVVSILVGAAIMGTKFVAWVLTGSAAVFADAAESVVNVVAGTVATYSVVVAARPADEDHPYGHGKAESLSAAIEGSMILVAAGVIALSAVRDLIVGSELQRLGMGIALSAGAGVANLGLGLYLVRTGQRAGSEAIEADGTHVLTDVVTTVGTVGALVAVSITGIEWLDPLVALLVAANIMRAGWGVVRRALGGLLDEADFELLQRLTSRLEEVRPPEWIEIHQFRAWSSGMLRHFDLHLAVPRYLSIEDAHRIGDHLEQTLVDAEDGRAEAVVHLDPCTPLNCVSCTMRDCSVRSRPLERRFEFDVESVTQRGSI